jgi:hypothetical protein
MAIAAAKEFQVEKFGSRHNVLYLLAIMTHAHFLIGRQ